MAYELWDGKIVYNVIEATKDRYEQKGQGLLYYSASNIVEIGRLSENSI